MKAGNSIIPDHSEINQNNFAGLVFPKLMRHKILFTAIIILCGIIGFAISKVQKPVYISSLTFSLDERDRENNFGGLNPLTGELDFNIGISENVFSQNNIAEIMISQRIIEKTLLSEYVINDQKTKLIEFYLNESGIRDAFFSDKSISSVHFKAGTNEPDLDREQLKTLWRVYSDFKDNKISVVKPNKRLDIYRVTFSSFSEKFSKIFIEGLLENTNEYYSACRGQKTADIVESLEKRIEGMGGRISGSLNRSAVLQDDNRNLILEKARVPLKIEEINVETSTGILSHLYSELELAKFNHLSSIPLLQVIDESKYPLKKIKTSGIKTALVFMYMGAVFSLIILSFSSESGSKKKQLTQA